MLMIITIWILGFKPKMINDILVYTEYIGIFASALHVNVQTRLNPAVLTDFVQKSELTVKTKEQYCWITHRDASFDKSTRFCSLFVCPLFFFLLAYHYHLDCFLFLFLISSSPPHPPPPSLLLPFFASRTSS